MPIHRLAPDPSVVDPPRMSLPQPSPDSGAEPIVVSDLLFDLIEFGLSGPLTNSGSLRDLLSTLRGIVPGLKIGRTSASGSVTVSLDVPFSNEDGIVMPPIRLELSLTTSTPSNVTVLGNSSIRLNGLHMLRADLGAADSGDPGLDGGVNVIGPFHGRGGHLFRRQMELVQQAIDRVGEVLRAAARYEKSLRYVDLRIRRAEACCDRNVPDARQITRYLKRVMLSGRRERRIDLYRLGAGEDVVKRSTVSHWIRSPLSPKAKAYAKRSDLLRAEITCPNRNSIRGLIAEAGTTRLDGNQAAGQLRALAVVLKPQLDDLVRRRML